MRPPAPELALGGSCTFSLGPVTQQTLAGQEGSCQFAHGTQFWQGSRSSGSQTLVRSPSAPGWRSFCGLVSGHRTVGTHGLLHLTVQVIILPLWKARGSLFLEFGMQNPSIPLSERYSKDQGWCFLLAFIYNSYSKLS